MMKKIILYIVISALCCRVAAGQTTQLKFDHFTQQSGLPDQQIQFISQDNLGYMWFGTLLGLVRYDGYSLKVYPLNKNRKDIWTITTVMDASHNLWFSTLGLFGATTTGLLKYNRKHDNFTSYTYPDKISKKRFQGLYLQFADDKGNLWATYGLNHSGNAQFAVRFDTRKKTFSYYGEQPQPKQDQPAAPFIGVRIFKSGVDGTIWMGDGKGLSRFDYRDNSFHPFFAAKDAANGQLIRAIYEAPSQPGVLWLNTVDRVSGRVQIARLNTRSKLLTYYSHGDSRGLTLANDSINAIYEDSRHRLWFATQNGLLLFSRQNKVFTAFVPADTSKGAGKNRIGQIIETKNGRLWMLSGKGLLCFDPDTHLFQRYTANAADPFAISDDNLTGLMFDRSGILWTHGDHLGIDKLNLAASAFHTYPLIVYDGTTDQVGFTNNVAATPNGYCWYTDNQHVFKWKPGAENSTLVYSQAKAGGGLDALFVGKDGKAYFDNRHGLSIFDSRNGSVQKYSFDKNDSTSISGNFINSIIQDHTGLVWIGTTTGGVCTFNPASRKFKRYPFLTDVSPNKNSGKLDNIVADCIYEDRQGTVWVGTHVGGLNRFDRKTGKFTSYYLDGKLNVYTVTHLFEDHSGHLWVGTYSLGLFEFDRKTGHYIRHINEDSGLLFNTVTGITQDDKDYLWVGSVRGLTRIDPKSMDIKTFPLNSILPGRSLIEDHNLLRVNNQMVLVLSDGLAVFNPRDLDPNQYAPQVHIESIDYSDPVSTSDSLTSKIAYGNTQLNLPYNQNRVTFNYIALHYADPGNNKYAYWLAGYDHHLVQAGNQRSATYTNLSPGAYTFHVTAANSDGVWNKKGDSFIVIIHPPWWLTWWAWALYVILFVAAIYGFVTYRSRKLLHDKRMLEHKVHIRTEEVQQQKEEIEAQRDSLEHTLGELKSTQSQLVQGEKMASLGELTAGIAHEIQNPLNFVNNFSEVSAELIDEMQSELRSGDKDEAIAISEDIKQNLEKIRHHGKRADFIVKGMLEHSRTSKGEKTLTNINVLADEFLKLSYHGLRAKDKNFNAELITHFDETLPKIGLVQQDIGRVLLNLFNNAFYAVNQKIKTAGPDYKPTVEVSTFEKAGQVEIYVKDNGNGIPDAIKDKIMQPFFTTKPTGEGTGLGLSLSYDIVVKGHGGSISVGSNEGIGAEFIIYLPIN